MASVNFTPAVLEKLKTFLNTPKNKDNLIAENYCDLFESFSEFKVKEANSGWNKVGVRFIDLALLLLASGIEYWDYLDRLTPDILPCAWPNRDDASYVKSLCGDAFYDKYFKDMTIKADIEISLGSVGYWNSYWKVDTLNIKTKNIDLTENSQLRNIIGQIESKKLIFEKDGTITMNPASRSKAEISNVINPWYVFCRCEELYLPDTVKVIMPRALDHHYITNLKKVYLPKDVLISKSDVTKLRSIAEVR